MAAIVFRRGAGVQRDGRAPLLLRDVAGFHERLMAVIDADADLGGNGDVRRRAHLHHALNDLAEQVGLPRQRGPAATTGDLGNRAAEVQVHMVGHVLIDDDARGLLDDGRVHAIQLQRPDALARREPAQAQRLRIAGDQRARRNHLGHVQAVRAVFLTQHAERPVRDARHRGEHHRRRHVDRPEIDWCHRDRFLPGRCVGARVEHVGLMRVDGDDLFNGVCHGSPPRIGTAHAIHVLNVQEPPW